MECELKRYSVLLAEFGKGATAKASFQVQTYRCLDDDVNMAGHCEVETKIAVCTKYVCTVACSRNMQSGLDASSALSHVGSTADVVTQPDVTQRPSPQAFLETQPRL